MSHVLVIVVTGVIVIRARSIFGSFGDFWLFWEKSGIFWLYTVQWEKKSDISSFSCGKE